MGYSPPRVTLFLLIIWTISLISREIVRSSDGAPSHRYGRSNWMGVRQNQATERHPTDTGVLTELGYGKLCNLEYANWLIPYPDYCHGSCFCRSAASTGCRQPILRLSCEIDPLTKFGFKTSQLRPSNRNFRMFGLLKLLRQLVSSDIIKLV